MEGFPDSNRLSLTLHRSEIELSVSPALTSVEAPQGVSAAPAIAMLAARIPEAIGNVRKTDK
jgi:hypothetical protein